MQCTLEILQDLIRDYIAGISQDLSNEYVRFRPYWVENELVFGTDTFLQLGSVVRQAPEILCAEFLSSFGKEVRNSCFSLNGFLNIKERELAKAPKFQEYIPAFNLSEKLILEIAHVQLVGRAWELLRLASIALIHAWFRQQCGLSTLVLCDSLRWEFLPQQTINFSHALKELLRVADKPSQNFQSRENNSLGYLALGVRGYDGADRVPRPRVMFTTSQLAVPSFTPEPTTVLSATYSQPIDLTYYLGRSTLDETFDPHVPTLAERANRGWWSRFLQQKLQDGAECSSTEQAFSPVGARLCYYKAAFLWEVACKDIKNAYVAFDRLWDGVSVALYPSHRSGGFTARDRGLLAEELRPLALRS